MGRSYLPPLLENQQADRILFAKTIFADNTYSKPYFVTYVNTSFFAISLIPIVLKILYDRSRAGLSLKISLPWRSTFVRYEHISGDDGAVFPKPDEQNESSGSLSSQLLLDESLSQSQTLDGTKDEGKLEGALSVWETAKISLEFCILWVRSIILAMFGNCD